MSNDHNQKKNSVFSSLSRINTHLSLKRKRQLFILLILMILLSFAEAISLASIVPFIGVFLNPEIFFSDPKFDFFINFFNIESKEEIFLPITLVFTSLLLISFIIKKSFLHLSNHVTLFSEADFKSKIFNYNINQNYVYHLKQNSNIVMSSLIQKTPSIAIFINSIFQILSSLLITISVLIVLLLIDTFVTLAVAIFVILFFIFVVLFQKEKLLKHGEEISVNQDKIVSIFQNSVGYMSETLLYSLQNIFIKKFDFSSYKVASNFYQNKNLQESPRIYLEYFILLLFVLIMIYFNQNDKNVILDLTVLAALGLGAQKILPLINRIHSSIVSIKGIYKNLLNVLDILDHSKIEKVNNYSTEIITLNKSIKLKNVSFKYNKEDKFILKDFNIKIDKGSNVGIKGTTGSGKTTLGHIIIGLIDPTVGQLIIDDKVIDNKNKISWQKNISIIPQTIFLHDVSIAQNIAIGVEPENIDMDKIRKVSEQARIMHFIEDLPEKYETKVGEKGVRLSGGQRQRIAIARALYRDAKVIIFDEATNQLDTDTESLIMSSISNLNKEITVIFITHRLSTLKNCDQVIDLSIE